MLEKFLLDLGLNWLQPNVYTRSWLQFPWHHLFHFPIQNSTIIAHWKAELEVSQDHFYQVIGIDRWKLTRGLADTFSKLAQTLVMEEKERGNEYGNGAIVINQGRGQRIFEFNPSNIDGEENHRGWTQTLGDGN